MNLTFENVDHTCAGAVEHKAPIVDLSNVTFFRPFAIVYLGMFLRYQSYCGKDCSVILPNNVIARNYLTRQNFWDRFNLKGEVVEREKLNRVTTRTSLNDIVDIENSSTIGEEVGMMVKKVLILNHVNTSISEVSNAVSELVDNFARHSKETLAAFHMQYYPNKEEFTLAIADCGIGIRRSLSSNPEYSDLANEPHHIAAIKAFEPGVTCSTGGMGLTEVRDSIISLNGRLFLSTGDEFIKMDADQIAYGQMAYDLTGVQVEVSFPVGG